LLSDEVDEFLDSWQGEGGLERALQELRPLSRAEESAEGVASRGPLACS
jgi:hypothetical protein